VLLGAAAAASSAVAGIVGVVVAGDIVSYVP